MSKKVIEYRKIAYFDNVKKPLVNEKRTFEVYSTSYTKKIKSADKSIIFNAEGHGDMSLLALINKVRRDGKNYGTVDNIKFVPQFDVFSMPEQDEIIEKIDIKSAYWEYAKKAGILTKDTIDFFDNKYGNVSHEYTKKIRVKALGSLATKKIVERYLFGVIQPELTTIQTEDTRGLYMSVRAGIDNLIRKICYENPGVVYYYVNCLFVKKGNFSEDARTYLLDSGYKVTTEETKIKQIKIGDTVYLESMSDKKRYLTRINDLKN